MRSILVLATVLLLAGCSDAEPAATTAAASPTPTTVGPSQAEPDSTTAAPTTAVTTTTAGPDLAEGEATTTTTEPPAELLGVELELVAEIDRVLAIAAPPGDPRVFLAQRQGIIHLVEPGDVVREQPFLDITDRVRANGIEQGLLGLAFHPQFGDNGRFFVYYTDENDDSRLVEFTVGADPHAADPATARELMFFDQPTDRHNAGMLQFGPDGYLYVAIGDGGDGGQNGQKPDTLLGTILRIDVDSGDPYAVPDDNPFVDGGGAAEVWLYGLRNPWRFSIDGDLIYVADVGQQEWEEVTVLPLAAGGSNLGWAYREGSACFNSPECDETESVLPTIEYPHAEGCSITGGFVYRGAAIPELHGDYFYSDWCKGWIRSFRYEDGEATDLREWPELEPGQVNTFGLDAAGELYLGIWGGNVWRLVPVRAEG